MSDSEAMLLRLADVLFRASQTGWHGLSSAEQVFLSVWELEAEVNNGGFNQYFFNSTGDRARGAPAALRSIGASNAAAIVDRALASFAQRFPEDRDARQAVLEEIDPDS